MQLAKARLWEILQLESPSTETMETKGQKE